jgi:hypothetical protein
MLDGIFRIAYTGTTGRGLGILVFHKGFVVGADTGGGTYDGSYTENPETRALDLFITLSLPAGAEPVMTGIPLSVAMNLPIRASLRQEDIDSDQPTLVQTILGPVNVLFKNIRDFP